MEPPPSDDADILIEEFELTRSLALELTALSTGGFIIGAIVFSAIYTSLTGFSPELSLQLNDGSLLRGIVPLFFIVILTLVVVLLHELIHGAVIRSFGVRPVFGAGLAYGFFPYAYVTAENARLSRNQFIAVVIAPLILISVLGTVFMVRLDWYWLVVPLAFNAGGSVGDLWMLVVVIRHREDVRIEDQKDGIRIYDTDAHPVPRRSFFTFVRYFLVGSALCAVVLWTLLGVVVPVLWQAIGGDAIALEVPGTGWQLVEYAWTADSGFSATISFSAILALSSMGGFLYGVFRRDR